MLSESWSPPLFCGMPDAEAPAGAEVLGVDAAGREAAGLEAAGLEAAGWEAAGWEAAGCELDDELEEPPPHAATTRATRTSPPAASRLIDLVGFAVMTFPYRGCEIPVTNKDAR